MEGIILKSQNCCYAIVQMHHLNCAFCFYINLDVRAHKLAPTTSHVHKAVVGLFLNTHAGCLLQGTPVFRYQASKSWFSAQVTRPHPIPPLQLASQPALSNWASQSVGLPLCLPRCQVGLPKIVASANNCSTEPLSESSHPTPRRV